MSDVLISLGIDASEVWQTVSSIEAKLKELSTLRLKVDMAELKGSVEASVRAQVAGTGALQRSLSELATALQGSQLRSLSSSLASAYRSLSTALAGLQSFRPQVAEWKPLTPARQPLLYLDLSKQYLPLQEKVASAMAMSAPQAQLRNVAGSLSRVVASMEQAARSEKMRSARDMGLQFYLFSSLFDRAASRIVSALEQAVAVFKESASAFQKTRIVTGASPQQFEQFQGALRELAREVMVPIPELSQIAYSFATRGYADIGAITDVLRPLAVTSLITGENMDTMARSILSLMQVWNPRTLEDLTRYAPNLVKYFSDMMSFAFAKSPLEVRWFKDIANYAAPLFARLGYSPQETMAFFMALSQMIPTPGIGARSARMFLFNIHDIERSMKIMEEYGINASQIFRQTAEEGGSLAEAFRRLYAELSKLPEETLVSIFKRLGGGVRGGMTAMMLSAGDIVSNIGEYMKKLLEQSAGYTAIVRAQYRATPVGALEASEAKLSAQLQELGSSIAYAKAALTEFKNSLLDIMNKMKGAVPALYGAGAGLQFASRDIFPILGTLALLQMAGGTKGLAIGGWAAAISAAIGAAIAGIGAAVMKERDKVMQEYISSMQSRGAGAVETALLAARRNAAWAEIWKMVKSQPWYAVATPSVQMSTLPKSYVSDLLKDVFSSSAALIQRIFASQGTEIVNKAIAAGAEIEARIREYLKQFGAVPATFANPEALKQFAKQYLHIDDKTATEFANIVKGFYTVFTEAGVKETTAMQIIPSILAAGLVAKEGGRETFEEFRKLMSILDDVTEKLHVDELISVLKEINTNLEKMVGGSSVGGEKGANTSGGTVGGERSEWSWYRNLSFNTMWRMSVERPDLYKRWEKSIYLDMIDPKVEEWLMSISKESLQTTLTPAHMDAVLRPAPLFH